MLLMPGSWGWSRGLVPFQADRGSFPHPHRCDSLNRTQTGSARAHTRRLFPPKGKRNLFQRFQACFLKCHFCKSPGPVVAFWGGGGQIQEILLFCKKCQVVDRLGLLQSSMRRESNFPLQGPAGPHCLQQAKPVPPLLAEGRRDITARSQDPSTCGDVRAPELSTHKLNCLPHSSSIPSLTGVRTILVPAQRQKHSTRTWPCLHSPCIRGISSHSLELPDQHWELASHKNPQGQE